MTQLTYWSFIIAILALLISIWGRIETFLTGSRQRKIELAKRVGEALVSAQLLKNTMEENVYTLTDFIENISNGQTKIGLEGLLTTLKKDYERISVFVPFFEEITGKFEAGKSHSVDAPEIEAKIALFNQRRLLAEFEITILNKKLSELK